MSKWPIKALGEIIEEVSERNRDKGCLDVYSVTNSQGFVPSEEYFNKKVFSKDITNYKLVRRGMFAYNPSRINVGSISWLQEKDCVAVSPLYVIFRIKDDTVLQKWIEYFLRSDIGLTQIRSLTSGSVRDTLKYSALTRIEIPVAPLEEQRELVKNLEDIDQAIETCNGLLDKTADIVKSRFIEMFGDPVTNPMGWESKSLLEMGDCKNGMNFHKGESGVELHCLGVGDFQNLSVIADTTELPTVSLNEMPSKDYLLQNEDIVFVRSNGNKNLVGRCVAVYPNDVSTVFSSFCIRFRLTDRDYLTTDYLLHLLKHESMRQKMTGRGANIQNLNQQILSALEIPLPPIDLQNQFAEFVALTDKSKYGELLSRQMHLKSVLQAGIFSQL